MSRLFSDAAAWLVGGTAGSSSRFGRSASRNGRAGRGGKRGERRLHLEPLEARQLFSVGPDTTIPPVCSGEAALAGTCSPDRYESDNDYSRAKAITTDGTAQVHSLHTATDVDWVTFRLDSYSQIVIGTAGRSGDTRLALYQSNPSGGVTQIARDDDGGGGGFSSIRQALDCGDYYVRVIEKGQDRTIGKYTISVTATMANPSRDAYENDNDLGHAKPISLDGTAQLHSLHTTRDADWLSFTLDKTSEVEFTFNTRGDLSCFLRDAQGMPIDYLPVAGDGTPDVTETVLEAGRYYLEVGAAFSGTVAGYSVGVNAVAIGPTATYMLVDNWGGAWWDAEKTPANKEDDFMCWAAATSNVLTWTGWGRVQGMKTADQVFRYFQDHWTDDGVYDMRQGCDWWFDGTNPLQGVIGSQVDVPGGGFFPKKSVQDYIHVTEDSQNVAGDIRNYLQTGHGVMLAIGNLVSGHAITCWGVDYDASTGTVRAIYVSDSDDSKRQANPPDRLERYEVVFDDGDWIMPDYFGGYTIDTVVALDRRRASAPKAMAVATADAKSVATAPFWGRRETCGLADAADEPSIQPPRIDQQPDVGRTLRIAERHFQPAAHARAILNVLDDWDPVELDWACKTPSPKVLKKLA